MQRRTALLLVVLAALLIAAGVSARSEGGGVLGRWLAGLHSNAGH